MTSEYAYLLVVKGDPLGAHFPLDPTDAVRVGRGTECEVMLTDPMCSRVHAEFFHSEDGWCVRDLESRNGTFLDGRQVQQAVLARGAHLRVGGTEFTVQFSDQPLTSELEQETHSTRSLHRDAWIDADRPGEVVLGSLEQAGHVDEWLLIYQLSLRLLNLTDADLALETVLGTLQSRFPGAWVGFFEPSDSGRWTLKRHVSTAEISEPPADLLAALRLAGAERRALWMHGNRLARELVDRQVTVPRGLAGHLVVPLVHQSQVRGAIGVTDPQRCFSEGEFDFVKSVTVLLCAALLQTRQHLTLRANYQRLADSIADSDELIGDSPPMRALKVRIRELASSSSAQLIVGERGSGKRLAARVLHRLGPRSDRPLLSVNCATLAGDLVESQLFGRISRGSASGDRDYPGWFQQADTTTLLIEEFSDLPLSAQQTLLGIIDDGAFSPVDAQHDVQTDVRLIFSTRRNLEPLVEDGKLHRELYDRLSGFQLQVPSLRDRGADVEMLIDYFLDHFRRNYGRHLMTFSPAARTMLNEYSWPGNVRQLRNVIDCAASASAQDVIEPADLALPRDAFERAVDNSLRIDLWERRLISQALALTDGKVPEAAELLGIGRATLYRKIDEYGIMR